MARVYQTWKGSNKFCLWGLCVFGPDVRSLLVSICLIAIPGTLFCVFVAYQLIDKMWGGIAVLPAAISLITWDLYILLFTACRDPGIVPRNLTPPQVPGGGKIPRSREVVVNGAVVKVKYCDSCLLYRPPRCSHCSICNNCIDRFDHHCPWVGQCIGRRNYRFFFTFVVSTTLLCIFVFAFSAYLINLLMLNAHDPAAGTRTVWQAMGHAPLAVVLMAFTFLAVWFVGGLSGFHIYLMCRNQTTYENFRSRYDKKPNPYTRGCYNNVGEALCSEIPPSRNNFRAKAAEAEFAISEPRLTDPDPPPGSLSASVDPKRTRSLLPGSEGSKGSKGSKGSSIGGCSPGQQQVYDVSEEMSLRGGGGGGVGEEEDDDEFEYMEEGRLMGRGGKQYDEKGKGRREETDEDEDEDDDEGDYDEYDDDDDGGDDDYDDDDEDVQVALPLPPGRQPLVVPGASGRGGAGGAGGDRRGGAGSRSGGASGKGWQKRDAWQSEDEM
ncbi:hypothetical protein CLOM_g22424 [Closterium sp. NIES-68]|nr:hypothetical protein CLOM_g22424 [Closterium sp. NIES-68]GJP70232.1 hypothetical protein CLOP_g1197 [Closterium sp. NIES-67]